jgi:hypothetical protein
MNNNIRHISTKIAVGTIFVMIIGVYSQALIMGNRGEIVYPPDPGFKSVSIDSYIIEGAARFLAAYSNTLTLLNRVELSGVSGVDYKELGILVNSAISNMEKAKAAYGNLKQQAEATSYNREIIDILAVFDYTRFRESKGLNPVIFDRIQNYLVKGDVNGVWGFLYDKTETLLKKMYDVKSSVDTARFPGIENLWRLNQEFSETILFGQYAAEIFFEIGK